METAGDLNNTCTCFWSILRLEDTWWSELGLEENATSCQTRMGTFDQKIKLTFPFCNMEAVFSDSNYYFIYFISIMVEIQDKYNIEIPSTVWTCLDEVVRGHSL